MNGQCVFSYAFGDRCLLKIFKPVIYHSEKLLLMFSIKCNYNMYVPVFGFLVSSSNCSVAYILTVMIMKEIPNKPAYAGKDKNSNLGYVSARTHVFEAH